MEERSCAALILLGVLLLSGLTITTVTPTAAAHTASTDTEEPSTPGVPVGVIVSTEVNSTHYRKSFTVRISDPGIYSFNASILCVKGFSENMWTTLSSSGQRYVPALDDYVHEEEHVWSDYFWWASTGWIEHYFEEFTFIKPGLLIIEFYSSSLYGDERFMVNFTISEEFPLSSAIPLSVGENTFKLTQEYAWAGYMFTPSQRGLYNFTVKEFLPYNTTSGWTPSTVYVFEPLKLFDSEHGHNWIYRTVNFQNFVDVGEGNSTYTQTWFSTILPRDYYFTVKTKNFLYLNGTYINLTIYVEPIQTLNLRPGHSVQLNFSSTNLDFFVALELDPQAQHNMYFDSPMGHNWTVYAADIVSGMGTPLIYSYAEYAGKPQTYELKMFNLTSLPQDSSYLGEYVPLQDPTGEHYVMTYVAISILIEYTNGTATTCVPYGGLYSLYNVSYLHVYGAPSTGNTPWFNVSLHLKNVGPFDTLTTSGDKFAINTTSGPIARIYQLPVQSGYIYEVTATPTVYTSNGYASISIIPSMAYENWFMTPVFDGTLLFIETCPPSYWPGGSEAYNSTVRIRFMSLMDDVVYVFVAGVSYMGVPTDTEEVVVNLTVTAPAPYTLGTDVTFTSDSFVGYSLQVVEGYSYRVTLDLYHPGTVAIAVMLDVYGNTPFNASESHIGVVAYSEGMMNFTGCFLAEETANVTLAIAPGSTVHFRVDVIDLVAPTVSITAPANGAIVAGQVTISFTAADDFGISSVTLTIDGDTHTVTGATSYTWDTSTAQPGLHIITLTAEDTSGNTASQTIAVLLLPEPGSYQSGLTLGLIFTVIGTIAALVIGILVGRLTKRS